MSIVDSRGAQGRRLPVYIIIDCSASMAGAPIEAIKQGVALLWNELMNTPQAVETAWMSVITCASWVTQLVPLTELATFQPPALQVGAHEELRLGAALVFLADAFESELVPISATTKGDYCPLVFIISDGEPTDDWRAGLETFRRRTALLAPVLHVFGCGPSANMGVFNELVKGHGVAVRMEDATPDTIAHFFTWRSQGPLPVTPAPQAPPSTSHSLIETLLSAEAPPPTRRTKKLDEPPTGARRRHPSTPPLPDASSPLVPNPPTQPALRTDAANQPPARPALPLTLVVDGSAAAAPLARPLWQGLRQLAYRLHGRAGEPRAVLSVVVADAAPRVTSPLGPDGQWQMPDAAGSDRCALGQAVARMREQLGQLSAPATARPLVIVMLAGPPSDTWDQEASWLFAQASKGLLNVFAIALGPGIRHRRYHRTPSL